MALIIREDFKDFNNEWKYAKGDIAKEAYLPDFDDSAFRLVSLPHSTRYVTDDDFVAYEGISYYRKTVFIPDDILDYRLMLKFDGIMQSSKIYVNGKLVKEHLGGYMGVVMDITDYVIPGEDNLIAVRTDSRGKENFAPTANKGIDFQFHGGIYRKAHLYVVNDIHISEPLMQEEPDMGGVIVQSVINEDNTACVNVRTYINCKEEIDEINVVTSLYTSDGELITESDCLCYEVYDNMMFSDELEVDEPILWSVNNPYLYILETKVIYQGEVVDYEVNYIGIRSIKWQKSGFYLNGERIELNGVNYHQDMFGVGNATEKDDILRDLRLIKEAGFNFIRCSHYPHNPVFYNYCDALGLLVMNSITGWQVFVDSKEFEENTLNELRQMIRQNRNNPSIILWEASINEAGFSDEWGELAHKTAHEEMEDIYTCAWKHGEDENSYPDVFLCAAQHGAKVRWNETNRPMIISEYGDWNFGGTNSTTRVSREDVDAKLLSQCANLAESLVDNRRQFENGEICGYCYWDFADYSPFSSEKTVIKCGVVDMERLPKHSFYLYKSQGEDTTLYIANKGLASSPKTITIYSNCEEVELFVNGKSYGIRQPEKVGYNNNLREEAGITYDENRVIEYKYLKHPPFVFEIEEDGDKELRAVGYINKEAVMEAITDATLNAKELVIFSDMLEYDNNNMLVLKEDKQRLFVRVCAVNKDGIIAKNCNGVAKVHVKGNIIAEDKIMNMYNEELKEVKIRDGVGSFYVTRKHNGYEYGKIQVTLDDMDSNVLDYMVENVKELTIYPADFYENDDAQVGKASDVAREKISKASSYKGDDLPCNGNNGNPGVWWSASDDDNEPWWSVDTLAEYNIESINIVWGEEAVHQYIIEVASENDNEYKVVVDKWNNEKIEVNTNDECLSRGRYVRIKVRRNEAAVKFNMFSVYGK